MLSKVTWWWKYICVTWLSCRNRMRDPEVVGLHVWRGKEGRDVETGELWLGWEVSQNQSYGLAELLCKFVEIDSKSIIYTCNTTTYLIVEVSGVRKTVYFGHWWGCAGYRIQFDTWRMLVAGSSDLFQHCPRSHQVQLRVGGRIHLLCGWKGRQRARMRTVEHAVYGEIERCGGLSADDFQVAVVEGGRGSPRRLLQRLVVFRVKASGTETNLLGNQHWRLHQLQNGVWGGVRNRDIWSAPLRKGGLARQMWQKRPESNWTQSAEGSESDEILRKCLTEEEKSGSHPIQARL